MPLPYRTVGLPASTPPQQGGGANGGRPQAGFVRPGVNGALIPSTAPDILRGYNGTREQESDYLYGRQTADDAADRDKSMLGERDRLNREAEDRAFARFKDASTVPLPGGETPGGGGPTPDANEAAARAAAFARAKEQSANIAQSSMTALRNALNSRGISGGGYANMKAAEALSPAANRLQDFGREQLIQDLDRSSQVADRDVATSTTRRGQDLNYRQSLLSLLNAGKLY